MAGLPGQSAPVGHPFPPSGCQMANGHGLQFIVTTPSHALDKHDRRRIKGNATKKRQRIKQSPDFQSWISPNREFVQAKAARYDNANEIPRQAGTFFSGLELPPGIEPYTIQELTKVIAISKHSTYPYEICVNVPPVERGWFPYMLSDPCCLHSMMYSLRVWESKASDRLACFHYGQTLKLLQARLNADDQTSAMSDATMMAVMMLATVAEIMNEHLIVESHIKGLEKIVKLRGGLKALDTHVNMHVKVCRADLSYAMISGKKPFLFRDNIDWNCFIVSHIQCNHMVEISLDWKLTNILRDTHALACMSNLAFQTNRKLSPDFYNEMIISVLYRLLHIQHGDDMAEALRLGLLCFSTTLFMQRTYMAHVYGQLIDSFVTAVCKLRSAEWKGWPVEVMFWLLMVGKIVPGSEREVVGGVLLRPWLAEVIEIGQVKTWTQAKEMLRSVAWVGFVHDEPGERAFTAATRSLDRSGNNSLSEDVTVK